MNTILSYLSSAREIENSPPEGLIPVNVAFLSTLTADLIHPYLVVEGVKRGMFLRAYFSPFNQLEQQIFDKSSSLYKFKPDVVIIATYTEKFDSMRLGRLITELKQSTTATILVFNHTGLAAALTNERLTKACQQFEGTYIFDYAQLVYNFGFYYWYDPKLWYLGRIPFGANAQRELGQQLARYIHALHFPPHKCLVLDLDGTLWGGVLGEEDGIELGEDYPGNVYKDFQRRLLALSNQGVLLAIASKNNEADTISTLQNNPDCILRPRNFAVIKINWQDKATNLRAIARELNISLDALAFFDDNPVEREWVRSQLPEVAVIEVPESPLAYIRALEESELFDQLVISEEDRGRTRLYQDEQERKQLQTISIEEFIQQLDMMVTVGFVNSETLPRVVQLLSKTNQFNLTTHRYTSSEVQSMIKSGAVALWIRVADRFGDLGLVGVAIAIPERPGRWIIDTFLLSCRVIGRYVETALLNILSQVVHDRGGQVLLGRYIPTPKNTPASKVYSDHGFEAVGEFWKWDFSKGKIPPPKFLRVRFENG